MLADEPGDLFLRYSLAMELASAERFDEAVEQFKKCLELDPTYLAAYVEAHAEATSGRANAAGNHLSAGKVVVQPPTAGLDSHGGWQHPVLLLELGEELVAPVAGIDIEDNEPGAGDHSHVS